MGVGVDETMAFAARTGDTQREEEGRDEKRTYSRDCMIHRACMYLTVLTVSVPVAPLNGSLCRVNKAASTPTSSHLSV